MSRGNVAALALLAGIATLAFLRYAAVLDHGLRSDDLLLVYYTDRLTGAVEWGRVFEEFGRGWFGAPHLYRPMITVTLAFDHWLWPGPRGMHASNVLFIAITAGATALLARRLLRRRGPLPFAAAALAGALVVLHATTVETTAWIAARVTSQQVAFGAVACLLFVRHLDGHGGRLPYLAAMTLALFSKEPALTLPGLLLLLDLLHGGHGDDADVRRRHFAPLALLRRHAPPFALLAGFLLLRLLVLGVIMPSNADIDLAYRLHNLSIYAGQLFAPPTPDGSVSWLACGWLLLPWSLWRARRWRLAFLLLAIPAALLPATQVQGHWAQLLGRLPFDALPFAALLVALAVAGDPAPRLLPRLLAVGGSICVLLAVALPANAWLDLYERENETDRVIRSELQTASADATGDRPFAFAGLPILPMYHAELWGALALYPNQPRDLDAIALPSLLFAPKEAPASFGDATPVHAILQHGGEVATWDATARTFRRIEPAPPGKVELRPLPDAAGGFAPPTPWPGTAVAAVEVLVPRTGAQVTLKLRRDMPDERALPPLTGTTRATAGDGSDDSAGAVWLQTSRALAPVLLQSAGLPFEGVSLKVDGSAPPPGTRVVVHARHGSVPAPTSLRGQATTIDELAGALRRPPRLHRDLRLYVSLPTVTRSMPVAGDGPIAWSPAVRQRLEEMHDLFAPLVVRWFWIGREHDDGEIFSTPLDWATLR